MSRKRKVLTAVSVLVFIVLTVLLWDIFKTISTEEGRLQFRNMITALGARGCLMLIGLNISQIFLFFIPGEMVELLAGMCYGAAGGLIVTYIGVLISTFIIFWLIRKVGKASVYDFIGKEKVGKIEKSSLINSRNAEKLLLLLFVIPGTPKDLLVYIGALLPSVRAARFILLSTLFRFPAIFTSTVAGSSFAGGDYRTAGIVYATTFVISLIILRYCAGKDAVREIMEINKG